MNYEGRVSLLLVGLHNSGKTHYGAQLLGRLRSGTGLLKMNGVATDLGAFEQAFADLAEGRLAAHSATESYTESLWPVVADGGGQADLIWPDYGGEQVRQLYQGRQVGEGWLRRIRKSDGWLFLIRPHIVSQLQDVWERPHAAHAKPGTTSQEAPGVITEALQWRDQAALVELLQILLYSRRADLGKPLRDPALVVALTCWDEMTDEMQQLKPDEVLRKHLPMLASFLESNWAADRRSVYGISALGKALQKDVPDEDFQNRGPAVQGWVIHPGGGGKDYDLTAPVARLIGMAKT